MTDEARSRRELWDERHAGHEHIESPDPDPFLVALAAPMTPGRAIDLAAGDGRNAIWLAAEGWQVTAVDFSGVAIERAKAAAARAGVAVHWVQADLLEWRPAPASAELVSILFLHLPRDERRVVLDAAVEALVPGGKLLVVGHDRSNLGQDVPGPSDPAVLYAPDEVEEDLRRLVVESANRVSHDLGDGRRSTDTVVVARRPAR